MNKKERMYQEIEKHGQNLNVIFGLNEDPIKLSKKLFSLENKAHHAATCLLNTNTLNLLELNRYTGYDVKQATEQEIDNFFDKINDRLYKILGDKAKEICFINFDARGYCLKIKSEYAKDMIIYKDWGGYGILAPDFNING